MSLRSGSSFAIVLTARNKANDFRVLRDSWLKYDFFFDVVLGVAIVVLLTV